MNRRLLRIGAAAAVVGALMQVAATVLEPDAAARGRGVYRALVAARWREAVARATPAATVQAGAMSRRILATLGFMAVAEVTVLSDRF